MVLIYFFIISCRKYCIEKKLIITKKKSKISYTNKLSFNNEYSYSDGFFFCCINFNYFCVSSRYFDLNQLLPCLAVCFYFVLLHFSMCLQFNDCCWFMSVLSFSSIVLLRISPLLLSCKLFTIFHVGSFDWRYTI